MIPQTLLAALGLSVADIVGSRALAVPLAEMLDIARGAGSSPGTFFRFINAYVQGIPGSTRQQAAGAYRQAKYWEQQGAYINSLDPQLIIDPRLAREVVVPSSRFVFGDNYRYHVNFNITFPGESKPQVFDVYVYRSNPTTIEGATSEAWERLMENFKSGSKPPEEGGTAGSWNVSSNITGFVNLIDRGF